MPHFLVALLKEGWTKDSIITESMIEVAFCSCGRFSGRNCLRRISFGMGLSIEMLNNEMQIKEEKMLKFNEDAIKKDVEETLALRA